jgi:hypothetical protein
LLSRKGRPLDLSLYWGKSGTVTEGLAWYPTDFLRDVVPIPCHSHNDYWRDVPLLSALYTGCISIESDVWLFNEELYVGHNTASLTTNRTFQSLYINRLVEILERQNPVSSFYNGTMHGVFDTHTKQSITLLIDLKTDGAETWPYVLKQLEPLRERGWLSHVKDGFLHQRPITAVGTGKTPFDVLTANTTYRDAFFDAPLDEMWEDPESGEGDIEQERSIAPRIRRQGSPGTEPSDSYTPLNSYYASTSFSQVIGSAWLGKLSSRQLDLIRGQVKGAHHRGLKARYWDLPAWPASTRNYVWGVLVNEGVDILNVDDLDAVKNGVW